MKETQRKISIFLAILGAVLMIACSGLYAFAKWRKEQITKVDIVATVVITVCSLSVFIISIICCYQGWHKAPSQKELRRHSTYVPITKVMGSNCGICIDPKDSTKSKVVELTCGHSFHKDCVIKSLETQPKCPICRQTPSKFSSAERVLYRMYGKVSKSIISIQHKQEKTPEDEESEI